LQGKIQKECSLKKAHLALLCFFKEKIMVHATISIYLGWITVATIANITAVLVKLDVGELFLGEVTWTIIVIIVAMLITLLMLVKTYYFTFATGGTNSLTVVFKRYI
jgi:hypothetical protein